MSDADRVVVSLILDELCVGGWNPSELLVRFVFNGSPK